MLIDTGAPTRATTPWAFSLVLLTILAAVALLVVALGGDPGIEHGCGAEVLRRPNVQCVRG